MTETRQLENLLAGANGGSVTIPRKHAQELAQKLKARGETGAGAKLAHKLDTPGDVSLAPEEAQSLLEQLRASGRRWVFGSNEARELPSMKAPAPGPGPEPKPEVGAALKAAETWAASPGDVNRRKTFPAAETVGLSGSGFVSASAVAASAGASLATGISGRGFGSGISSLSALGSSSRGISMTNLP